jgi:hypothetical protein
MNRTKEERQNEVRVIIEKLTQLRLTAIYEPIRDLMGILKTYIDIGNDVKINIPFNEIRKTIVGCLFANSRKECWLKLENKKK